MHPSYSHPNPSPVGRGGTAFGAIIVFAVTVVVFYLYLHLSDYNRLSPDDAVVQAAAHSARARGGATHPLLSAFYYVISYIGREWFRILTIDSLDISQKAVAAAGVGFLGGYLLQRFKSILVAIGGMTLLAFSFVYWRGALTMNPHQLAMMFFLAALCCVAEPSYGRELVRLRDMLAAILLALAVLSSQYLILFVPAFLACASERWEPRVHLLTSFLFCYAGGSAAFFIFYTFGPSDLFTGTTLVKRILEWVSYRPAESARLILDSSAGATASAAAGKLSTLVTEALNSVIVGRFTTPLALLTWLAVGMTAIVITTLESTRREGLLVLLMVVPTLASVYLQSNASIEQFLPLAAGFSILASALLGYFTLGTGGPLSLVGPLLLFFVFAPSFAYINYAGLKGPAKSALSELFMRGASKIPR